MPSPNNSSAPVLEIRNLSCRIDGREVLRSISLDLHEREIVVLLGRSGCGKTTLLKCVNGLLQPSAGEILFQSKPQLAWDTIRLRRQMGYVIQDAGLFPHWTVADNVAVVPKLEQWEPAKVKQRVADLLEMVGLPAAEFGARYPRQLSGGQKQRVSIARALAADPPLLLLDEPFAALDPITRFELQKQFRELRTRVGKAALFVTHDVREALFLANRIVLLKDGAIDWIAEPAAFLTAPTPEARAFLAGLETDGRMEEPHEPAPL